MSVSEMSYSLRCWSAAVHSSAPASCGSRIVVISRKRFRLCVLVLADCVVDDAHREVGSVARILDHGAGEFGRRRVGSSCC